LTGIAGPGEAVGTTRCKGGFDAGSGLATGAGAGAGFSMATGFIITVVGAGAEAGFSTGISTGFSTGTGFTITRAGSVRFFRFLAGFSEGDLPAYRGSRLLQASMDSVHTPLEVAILTVSLTGSITIAGTSPVSDNVLNRVSQSFSAAIAEPRPPIRNKTGKTKKQTAAGAASRPRAGFIGLFLSSTARTPIKSTIHEHRAMITRNLLIISNIPQKP
jgi:hypothetical protein